MKILVLGATGMLGHRLLWGLDELGYEVLAGVRTDIARTKLYCGLPVFRERDRVVPELDCYDIYGLRERLLALHPDVIINCVGVIKQLDEGRSSVPCIALNALLPHVLEGIVAQWDGWLIHFSTDCVFNGDRGHYTEDDPSDVADWYGRTKYMGEVQGPNALTLRTSIVGRELKSDHSLVDWFLSQEGKVVKGFDRAIYSGVTTREMVHVIDLLLRKHGDLRGLYHVASEPISKYRLLSLIRDTARLDIRIERDDQTVQCDRSLLANRFYKVTGYRAPDWRDMVQGLVEDIHTYRSQLGLST